MITISPDRASYPPGATVTATVSVKLSKPVKARGLYATLECNERKRVKVERVMDTYDYEREHELGIPRSRHIHSHTEEHSSILFSEEKKLAGEREYSSETFEVSFRLPHHAKPTSRVFGHDNKIHVWKIRAKLDIPFAFDENASEEIFVEGL